jgi:hypothetical protein
VKSKAVTVLPIVLAILFMLLLSMLSIAAIARAMFSGVEASKREAEEHQVKMKQWVKTYIYNVSLCKMLNLMVKAMKGQTISQQELDVSGPVKILVANEGGGAVRLEHMMVQALGSIVHEVDLDVKLQPGGWIVYSPRELGLPEDYKALMDTLDTISFFGGRETYNTTYFQPPPITYVEVRDDGTCVEP